ncbi:hypothetical protein ACFOMD_02055 [Sphingoaurantiacus capsulatus]|uniref:Uncharacterized protein n=1 Tax=Sphingoaurantiacus capsulatus TaxID=1771310 RepID=A0ABV7X7D2_9SPHN
MTAAVPPVRDGRWSVPICAIAGFAAGVLAALASGGEASVEGLLWRAVAGAALLAAGLALRNRFVGTPA